MRWFVILTAILMCGAPAAAQCHAPCQGPAPCQVPGNVWGCGKYLCNYEFLWAGFCQENKQHYNYCAAYNIPELLQPQCVPFGPLCPRGPHQFQYCNFGHHGSFCRPYGCQRCHRCHRRAPCQCGGSTGVGTEVNSEATDSVPPVPAPLDQDVQLDDSSLPPLQPEPIAEPSI
jgi:hypothetical protein